MGNSQAMKTSWLDDLMALVPPIAFLFAVRFRFKPPNEQFPYGYHRTLSIAFLCASVALAGFGLYLLFDAVMKLVQKEHPSIGMIEIFGWRIWLGWLMIAALIYSAILPVVLGYMKLPLARELHEKVLRADADMNKANWLAASAAILGILGVGMGWWWADSVAAAAISLEIIRDGFTNLKNAVMDTIQFCTIATQTPPTCFYAQLTVKPPDQPRKSKSLLFVRFQKFCKSTMCCVQPRDLVATLDT